MKSRIDIVETFLGDTENTRRIGHYIEVYHPVIPFRDWKKVIRNIIWAKNTTYWEGEYCLANRNCEHLANMMVYGINYSKQAIERPQGASFVDFFRDRGNHGVNYWTSVNLQSMIRSSSQKFDNLKSSDDYQVKEKIKEIKGSESE